MNTPAPWRVFNPRLRTNPSSERRLLVLHPDGERIIARMDEGFVNGKGAMTLEEREANARLIAAAPELLAACQQALEALTPWNNHEEQEANIKLQIAIKLATQP